MFEALQTETGFYQNRVQFHENESVNVAQSTPYESKDFFMYKSLSIFKEAIQSNWNVFQVMGTGVHRGCSKSGKFQSLLFLLAFYSL